MYLLETLTDVSGFQGEIYLEIPCSLSRLHGVLGFLLGENGFP